MPPRLRLVCVLFSTATLLHAIGDTLITVIILGAKARSNGDLGRYS